MSSRKYSQFRYFHILTFIIICICLNFTQQAVAWSTAGHRKSFDLTWPQLDRCAQTVIQETFDSLHAEDPSVKQLHDIAAWPDWIKVRGDKRFNRWHYVKQTFTSSRQKNDEDLVWALEQAVKSLQADDLSAESKAHWVSFLIHLVGDAHQPLHALSRESVRYPQGDLGGNLFPIQTVKGDKDNLHHLWDAAADVSHPTVLCTAADAFDSTFEPQAWILESADLAQSQAYALAPGDTPSSVYIETMRCTATQQLDKSANRLAALLNNLFGCASKNLT